LRLARLLVLFHDKRVFQRRHGTVVTLLREKLTGEIELVILWRLTLDRFDRLRRAA